MTYTHEGLADSLCAAVEAESLRLNSPEFTSVSTHAYHAGLRDAYLKVLATIGEQFVPNVTDEVARLAPMAPAGPNPNVFEHHAPANTRGARLTDIQDASDLAAEIAAGVSA